MFLNLFKIICLLYFTQFALSYTPPADFCNVVGNSCTKDGKSPERQHLFCGGKAIIAKDPVIGTTPLKLELDDAAKDLIIERHNEFRNIIACRDRDMLVRNIKGDAFPKAAKMPKLMWNNELEWAADLNGKTCSNTHDCPFTVSFPRAGQNIAGMSSETRIDQIDFLNDTIRNWWSQFLNTPLRTIKKGYTGEVIQPEIFAKFDDGKAILESGFIKNLSILNYNSAFTMMMREKTSRVGCALYDCGPVRKLNHSIYLVCNYEYTNWLEEPVYETVKESEVSGSKCGEKSKRYCCLCLLPSDRDEPGSICFNNKFKLPNFLPSKFSSTSQKSLHNLLIFIAICFTL